MPPWVVLLSRALGSAGGGDSTESEMICAPRTIVNPRVRFSSVSSVSLDAPGAEGLFRRLIRRNSSVSARTRFMCLSNASIWPVIDRPSFKVTLIRQLICVPSLAIARARASRARGSREDIRNRPNREMSVSLSLDATAERDSYHLSLLVSGRHLAWCEYELACAAREVQKIGLSVA
jgi:hypothetical protein